MPKISIYEQDISAVDTTDILENVVFIPGIASQGVFGVPTRCDTLEEFQSKFGKAPIKFAAEQKYPESGTVIYEAPIDSYEQSYIYACEILKMGLPIYFERMNLANENVSFTEVALTKDDYIANKYFIEDVQGNKILSTDTFDIHKQYYEQHYIGNIIPGIYDALEKDIFAIKDTIGNKFELQDKDKYNIKFITSGSYPILEYVKSEEKTDITYTQTSISDSSFQIDESVTSETYEPGTYYLKDGSVYTKEDGSSIFDSSKQYYRTNIDVVLYLRVLTESGYMYVQQDGSSYNTSYKYYTKSEQTIKTTRPFLMQQMLKLAALRGDCVALIDHKLSISNIIDDVYYVLNSRSDDELGYINISTLVDYAVNTDAITGSREESSLNYGAVVTPWAKYLPKATYIDKINGVLSVVDLTTIVMPGSFGYLLSLAKSTLTYPDWYAVAGVIRGLVPNFKQLITPVSGSTADFVQQVKGVSIIPITFVNPYGNCIWGNRTMHFNDKADLVASSFLNVRMLANDVKKQVYYAAKKLMFETDSTQLWLDFKSKVTPLLDKMVTGNGLSAYNIKRVDTNRAATVKITITLYCIEAVENFDVTLNITDSVVELSE